MKSSSLLLLPATLTAAALDAVAVATNDAGVPCYFANGELAAGYQACHAESPASYCCPGGYTCSSRASCVPAGAPSFEQQPGSSAPGTVSRGACTEPRWNGDSCGSRCLGKSNRSLPV